LSNRLTHTQSNPKQKNQHNTSTNDCEINFLRSHVYFPFFLLFLSLNSFINHKPNPNTNNVKTITKAIAPGDFKSPKKFANKSAVSMYLATSNNHFPNSYPIRFSLKDTTNIQLFVISYKKNEENIAISIRKWNKCKKFYSQT